MATAGVPEYTSVLAELAKLERDEREISSVRRKLHERLASFPNELTEAREREISAERRKLHRRIDVLRALLGALGWQAPSAPA
jgi:septal ring factor EnvC (AmiA/AmiB activator)